MKKSALIMMMVILALMSLVPLATAHDSTIINEMIDPAVNATDTKGNCNGTVNITLEVKGTNRTEIPFPGSITMIFLSNITFDAIIPSPRKIEKHPQTPPSTIIVEIPWNTKKHPVGSSSSASHNEWELRDSTIYSYTKMTGMLNNVTKEPKMERLVIELEPGAEVANLSFDPMFELFYSPLYVGKNWTTTTNVTGILVNETGIESPIDSFAVVAGAVIEEVEVIDEMDQTPTFGLVIEVNISFEVDGEPVSCLIRYWVEEPPTIFPRDLCDAFAEREEDEGGHSI